MSKSLSSTDIMSKTFFLSDSFKFSKCFFAVLLAIFKRELIGTSLGQFHADFPFEGKEVYATGGIFLGKKAYMDIVSVDGRKEYHLRMKTGVLFQKTLRNTTKN